MSNSRKIGEVTIEIESIRLPEEVLDYLMVDEGDKLYFFEKDGQLIVSRNSTLGSSSEASSSSPEMSASDIIDLRRKIEELIKRITKEMDFKNNMVEFSDILSDRIMEVVSQFTKKTKSPSVDPMNMIKSLFGEKGSEMASELTKNFGKVMSGVFDAFQNIAKPPFGNDDNESYDEYYDDVEIEDEDTEIDDDEDEDSDGFKIDID